MAIPYKLTFQMFVFAGDGSEEAFHKEVQKGRYWRKLQRCPGF